MRRAVVSVFSAAAVLSPAYADDTASNTWRAAAATEVRYFSWRGTQGFPGNVSSQRGSGAEIYVPIAVELVGRPHDDVKVEVTGRGGWVWARQSTAGATGEVATTTDTVTAATVTYLGFNGIHPFVSLDTNLPTGRSALGGGAANARMDPDLVDIASFGEGFNLGPTAGFNLPLSQSTILTFSAGYTFRGRYQRESNVNGGPFNLTPADIDPGDVFTLSGSVTHKSGALQVSLAASVAQETVTTQNGVALMRAGRRYAVNGTLAYSWPDAWGETSLSAALAHSEKNSVAFLSVPSLMAEPANSNSNLYRFGVEHLFRSGAFAFGPTGSFLYRDANGYDATTLQFVPAKTRWAFGTQIRYAASNSVMLNARLEHIWTREDDSPAGPNGKFSVLANAFLPGSAVPVISSDGWQAAVGITVKY